VAALVGLLAVLSAGAGAPAHDAARTAAQAVVAGVDVAAVTAVADSSHGVVTDAVRPGVTVAARPSTSERQALGHAGSGAVPAGLLLLAAVLLAVGVRRSTWRRTTAALAAVAPRGPPASLCC